MRTATLATAMLTGGLLLTACSEPSAPPDPSGVVIQIKPVEGTYEVEVREPRPTCDNLGTQVDGDWTVELGAGERACYVAIVKDGTGAPPSRGTVTWQACRLRSGLLVPKSNCDRGGEGRWNRVISQSLDQNGAAILLGNIGANARFPERTFGFRYIYRGQGSGVANHTEAFDVTHVFAP